LQYFSDTGQDTRSVFGGKDKDLMHHLINNGSMADCAYTQEQGQTARKKKRLRKKKEARKRRTRSWLLPPRPQPRRRGRRRRHQRREEEAEVQSGDLWRMNASPRHGR
jgi:hypothetical protein